jgi:Family of unknown function (DUF5681)
MSRPPQKPSGEYPIGYGRPPVESQFRKGESGNPRGRPRGTKTASAKAMVLQEAYRPITVREGDDVLALPAIQAVMRQLVRLAAKRNGPAQRRLIDMVQTIEQELTVEANAKAAQQTTPISDADRAKALAAFLEKTKHLAPEDHAMLVRAIGIQNR